MRILPSAIHSDPASRSTTVASGLSLMKNSTAAAITAKGAIQLKMRVRPHCRPADNTPRTLP
jgi:hypothetical protein